MTRVLVWTAHAQLADHARHGGGGAVGIEMTIARQVNRSKQVLRADLGHDAHRFGGRDDLHIHTDALGAADAALQLTQLLLGGSQAQAANMVEQPQRAVQLDAVLAELHQGI